MDVLVYTQRYTHRTGYIFRFIFEEILGVNVRFTSSYTEVKSHLGVLISYYKTKVKDSIHIVPHNLLIDDSIAPQKIDVFEWEKMPAFFKTSDQADIPFDIFAASFYLVSRYEEYLNFEPDIHGRFPSSVSLGVKAHFFDQPVIDQWAYKLTEIIQSKYPAFEIQKRKFNHITTIDVDNAFAFLNKGVLRSFIGTFLSLVKLDFKDFIYRLNVYTRQKSDPYDVHDQMISLIDQPDQAIWFIPTGKIGSFDRNISINNEALKNLVNRISLKHRVGIHPSYRSGIDVEKLRSEIAALVDVLDKEVTCSRQHYLRLIIPFTYRNLVVTGITEDYTMGYSDKSGFRASTCTPFKFFDLQYNRVLNLKVYPFQTMDFTLFEKLNLSPQQAIEEITKIIHRVKAVDGTFVSIWHNEYFSGYDKWSGYEIVLPAVINELKKVEGGNQAGSI